MSSLRLMILAFISISFAGCGDGLDLPKAYSVTGKVTAGGAPLSGYLVSFVAADGKGTGGGTANVGSDGAFSLETLDGRPGCEPGKYKVVIRPGQDAMLEAMKNMKPRSKGTPKMESKVPESYGAATTSPKEVEVKAQSNVIDISI